MATRARQRSEGACAAGPAAGRGASAASAAPGLDSGSTPATLRVAGVDPELGFGGGVTQVLGLTLELLRAGHRAELVCDAAYAMPCEFATPSIS